jgi:hypothetical protein
MLKAHTGTLRTAKGEALRMKEATIQVDNKQCELLHKFIGKKAIITQKLNAHQCKKQLRKSVFHT